MKKSGTTRLIFSICFLLIIGLTNMRVSLADADRNSANKQNEAKKSKSYTYKVRGEAYTTLSSSENYDEEGLASWYGKPFHGRKTANGEIFDMHTMTAAHKTLPLGTKVKVTNLKNNIEVIVKINDRGPFHGDRLIDLSYAAAEKLDFVDSGITKVRITTYTK